MPRVLSSISRWCLFALVVFPPLARASVQGWAQYLIALVALAGVTALACRMILEWDGLGLSTALDRPLAALFIWVLAALAASQYRPGSVLAFLLFCSCLAAFYLTIHTMRTRLGLRRTMWLIMGVGGFLSLFGAVKLAGLNPFGFWEYPELENAAGRMASTYGNPDHLAGFLEMALFVTLGYLFAGSTGWRFGLAAGGGLVMLLALMLTLSRGAWIGVCLALLFCCVVTLAVQKMKSRRLAVLAVAAFAACVLMVLGSTTATQRMMTLRTNEAVEQGPGRVEVWGGVVEMIADYPVFGVGPGNFSLMFTQYQPPGFAERYTMAHNDFLQVVAETGLITAILVIWLGFCFFRAVFAKLTHPSRLVRGSTLGATAGVLALCAHGMVDFNLHVPANALVFSILAAMATGPAGGRLEGK